MSYTHLTQEDRVKLAALLRAKLRKAAIARELGVDRSTISRELARNTDSETGQYHAGAAGRKTRARRKEANQRFLRIEQDACLRRHIARQT
jgi:IS30 family transposase